MPASEFPAPSTAGPAPCAQGAILPEWVGIDILDRLEEAFLFPVFIDNDANLGALSEVTWGPHSGISNLMFMKIGSGIGAGLILNGDPYYGNVGITGEIGHATIHEHGLICRCGNRGCLETIASTTTMIELLSRGEERPLTPEDIVREGAGEGCRDPARGGRRRPRRGQGARERGEPDQPRSDRGGRSPGGLGDILLDPIRRGLVRHAVPVIGETTTLTMSSLSDRAEALGRGGAGLPARRNRRNVAFRYPAVALKT